MTGDQWEFCNELAIMDVQVRSTDPAGFDFDLGWLLMEVI